MQTEKSFSFTSLEYQARVENFTRKNAFLLCGPYSLFDLSAKGIPLCTSFSSEDTVYEYCYTSSEEDCFKISLDEEPNEGNWDSLPVPQVSVNMPPKEHNNEASTKFIEEHVRQAKKQKKTITRGRISYDDHRFLLAQFCEREGRIPALEERQKLAEIVNRTPEAIRRWFEKKREEFGLNEEEQEHKKRGHKRKSSD